MIKEEILKQVENLVTRYGNTELFKLSFFSHFGEMYLKIESDVNKNIYSIKLDNIKYVSMYHDNSATIYFHNDGYFHLNWIDKLFWSDKNMSYHEEAERKTKIMIVEENEKLKEENEKIKSDITYLRTLCDDQYKTINELMGKIEMRDKELLNMIGDHENLVKSFSNFTKVHTSMHGKYEEIKNKVLKD